MPVQVEHALKAREMEQDKLRWAPQMCAMHCRAAGRQLHIQRMPRQPAGSWGGETGHAAGWPSLLVMVMTVMAGSPPTTCCLAWPAGSACLTRW